MEKEEFHNGGRIIETAMFVLLGLFLSFSNVQASIHEYRMEAFSPKYDAFYFNGGSEGLYASKLHHQPVALSSETRQSFKGKSFIRFDSVTFVRPKESANKQNEMQQNTGLVEAIIIESKDRARIGGAHLKNNAICCNKQLWDQGYYCKVGEVIIQNNPDNPGWPKRFKTFFQGNNEEVKMDFDDVEINRTGMYYLYFMFCDPQLKGTLIKGKTVWKNPDGYLPGMMAPLMTFFGLMSLAYLVLGLGWFLRFVQFWEDIIHLHYHITLVIALGTCEMAVWYFEYSNFNSTGSRTVGITLWAVTFGSIKRTLFRLLLLVVSMGFGVFRPTLGGLTSKVLLFGLIYFIATEALDLKEHLGNIIDFPEKIVSFLVILVALLEVIVLLWSFALLSKTLEKLQKRRNLALYRKFANALAVYVLLAIAGLGISVILVHILTKRFLVGLVVIGVLNLQDSWHFILFEDLWQMAWITPAFYHMLAYSLLVVICVLWAPSRNPTRFAYMVMEEMGEDFDEKSIPLIAYGGGDMATELERQTIEDDAQVRLCSVALLSLIFDCFCIDLSSIAPNL